MIGFLYRLFKWAVQILVAIDQLFCTWLRGWGYVWFNTEKPNADETISSWVGRRAVEGSKWALNAEKIINKIFFWDANHCRKRIDYEELDGH